MLLPEPIERCARTLRASARREDGFTIVEVLVSAVLVAVAAVGTFAAFDSATATSGNNKARSVAAGLAQADQERMRAMTPLQLADVDQTQSKNVDGKTYTLVSKTQWVNDPSGTTSCAGMGKEAGYQKLTSTVTWPGMGAIAPVQLDSIKAVPNGGYKDSRGSLAVKITDRNGTGVPGVSVTATGPKTVSASTSSQGCVLLGFLPVGTYTVSFSQGGYVESALPNNQAISKVVQVAGEQTTSTSFTYDQAASLDVAFMTRRLGASSDAATTGDGFSVGHSGLGFPNFRGFGLLSAPAATAATGASNTAVAPASAVKVLFPFTSRYSVWAGKCAENNPALPTTSGGAGLTIGLDGVQGTSGDSSWLLPPNSANSGRVVFQPAINVTVQTSAGGTLTQAARVRVSPTVTGCTAVRQVDTATNGTIAAASQPTLPYGAYSVCAQDRTTSPTRRVIQSVNNFVRNGTSVTLRLPSGTTTPAACP